GSGESLEQALGEKPREQAPNAASKQAPKPKQKPLPGDERIEREAQVSEAEKKKLKDVMGLVKTLDFSGDAGSDKAERLLALFKTAALVDNATIDDVGKATKTAGDIVKSLLIREAIDPMTFEAGVGCDKLMEANKMRPEQAIIALGYCQRSRVGLKEAQAEPAVSGVRPRVRSGTRHRHGRLGLNRRTSGRKFRWCARPCIAGS